MVCDIDPSKLIANALGTEKIKGTKRPAATESQAEIEARIKTINKTVTLHMNEEGQQFAKISDGTNSVDVSHLRTYAKYKSLKGNERRSNDVEIALLYENTLNEVLDAFGTLSEDKIKNISNGGDVSILYDAIVKNVKTEVKNNRDIGLEASVRSVLMKSREYQNKVDKNKDFKVLFNQKLWDYEQNSVKKADIIIIYSDGTTDVFNFDIYLTDINTKEKDKTRFNGGIHSFMGGNLGFNADNMNDIKKILVNNIGIKKVVKNRLIPVIGKAEFIYTQNGSRYLLDKPVNFITRFSDFEISRNENLFLDDVILNPEEISKDDPELSNILNKLISLRNRKRSTGLQTTDIKFREELTILTTKLGKYDSIAYGVVYFDQILNLLQKRIEEIESIEVNPLTVQELNEYVALVDSFRAYIHYRSGIKSDPETGVKNLNDELFGTEFNKILANIHIKYQLVKNKLNTIIREDLESYGHVMKTNTTDGHKLTIEVDSYLSRLFLDPHNLKNPILNRLQERLDRATTLKNDKIIGFYNDFSKVFIPALKKAGSRSNLAKIFLDVKNQEINGLLDKRFHEDKKKALLKNDLSWFKKHYFISKEDENLLNQDKELEIEELKSKHANNGVNLQNALLDLEKRYETVAVYNHNKTRKRFRVKESTYDAYASEVAKPILNTPEYRDLYMFLKDLNYKFKQESNYTLNLEFGFFPRLEIEGIRKAGIQAKDGLSMDLLVDLLIPQNQRRFDDSFDKEIPILFMEKLADSKFLNTDIDIAFLNYANTFYNSIYLQEVEAIYKIYQTAVENKEIVQEALNADGKPILDNIGRLKTSTDKLLSLENMLRVFADSHIYGIALQNKGKNINVLGKKVNTVDAALRLSQTMSVAKLGYGVIGPLSAFLSARLQLFFERSKGTTFDNATWTNAVKEMTTNRKKAAKYYLFLGLAREDIMSQVSITGGRKLTWSDNQATNFFDKYLTATFALSPFRKGDELLDETISLSIINSWYVNKAGVIKKKVEGRVMTDDFIPIKNILKDTKDGLDIEYLANDEAVVNFKTALRVTVNEAQKKIKGGMGSDEKAMAESFILSKLLLHFKRWMPNVMRGKFTKLTYNKYLQEMELGNYGLIVDPYINAKIGKEYSKMFKIFADNAVNFLGELAIGWTGYHVINLNKKVKKNEAYKEAMQSWVDRFKEKNPFQYKQYLELYGGNEEKVFDEIMRVRDATIKTFVLEARMITALILMYYVLRAGLKDLDDDDDKAAKFAMHKALQVSSRVLLETQALFNPVALLKLTQGSPIPLMNFVKDFIYLGYEVVDDIDDTVRGQDSTQDQTTSFDAGLKLVRIQSLARFLDATENFEESEN